MKTTEKSPRSAGSRSVGTILLGSMAAAIACLVLDSAAPALVCASAGLIALSLRGTNRVPHIEARVNESLKSAISSGVVGARRHSSGLRYAAIRRPGMAPGLHLRRRPRARIRSTPLDMLRRPLRPLLRSNVPTLLVRTAA